MSERVATEKCPVCGKAPSPITTPNSGAWDAFFKCDCGYVAGLGSTRNEALDDAAEVWNRIIRTKAWNRKKRRSDSGDGVSKK